MVNMAATTCLDQVQESENQLYQASETYRRVLELADDPPWPAACEAYLGLALAAPDGGMRLFLDEGAAMAALLEEAVQHGIASAFVYEV